MDSLLANYASSDDDEEQPPQQQQQQQSTSSFFSALPKPKSSSLFSSLPQPHKSPITKTPIQPKPNSDNSSIFSALPQPKSQSSQLPEKSTKRVVRIIPTIKFDEDDEDGEEEKQRKKRKESQILNQDSSVKSFLSSIPAPKSSATLGVLHSNQGSGRRSIIETEAPAASSSVFDAKNESSADQNEVSYASYELGSDQNAIDYANQYPSVGNYASHEVGSDQNTVDYANHYQNEENYTSREVGSDQNVGNYENYVGYESGIDPSMHSVDASSYVNYASYNGHGDYGQFGSGVMVQETAGFRVPRRRGKNEIPTEIVEVKQDELMKDRPREDQVKLTGKAFGPSYQPVSTKGKPTKLHKRKHQIGSLYFDMKQKEMELAERRARGYQTKAQTQGKYGW